MEMLAIAYALSWGLVSCYIGWISLQYQQLSRRIDELEAGRDERNAGAGFRAKAG